MKKMRKNIFYLGQNDKKLFNVLELSKWCPNSSDTLWNFTKQIFSVKSVRQYPDHSAPMGNLINVWGICSCWTFIREENWSDALSFVDRTCSKTLSNQTIDTQNRRRNHRQTDGQTDRPGIWNSILDAGLSISCYLLIFYYDWDTQGLNACHFLLEDAKSVKPARLKIQKLLSSYFELI